jgi:hypothetical protein
MVPLGPLRERYLALDNGARPGLRELARRLEWFCPDQNRAGRALGIHKDPHTGKPSEYITYDTAVRICEALGFDPVDVGL